MKNYFCKYLPVEGEIKNGDKYITEDGILRDTTYQTEDGRGGTIDRTHDKKVELFLCSRDIVEGDEVQDESGFKYNVDDRRFKLLSKENEYLKTKVFKVIGKISPEATWVKEGDEFDENQLQIKYHITYRCLCKERDGCEDESCQHYEGGVNKYVNGCYRQELLRTAYEIKVKGPCGHFH